MNAHPEGRKDGASRRKVLFLHLEDCEVMKDGVLRVCIQRSKTGHMGRAHEIFVNPAGGHCCLVRLFKKYRRTA
jgi:hypothetical protein